MSGINVIKGFIKETEDLAWYGEVEIYNIEPHKLPGIDVGWMDLRNGDCVVVKNYKGKYIGCIIDY